MKVTEVKLSGGGAVQVEEAGDGPPILLLHAGVSERHMWDHQWEWLSLSMRTVRWDQRGFGQTAHVPGPFSYAGDVIQVMDALHIDQAILVGCSMGGATAIQVAVEHPARVVGLVLSGSGVPGYAFDIPPDIAKLFSDADEAFRRDDVGRALEILERTWLIGPGREAGDVNPDYLERARTLLRESDRPDEGAVSTDQAWSAQGLLPEIRVPVLVIVGSNDLPPILESAAFLADTLPKARYALIDHAAHLPNMEEPNQFDTHLREWLGDVACQPGYPQ